MSKTNITHQKRIYQYKYNCAKMLEIKCQEVHNGKIPISEYDKSASRKQY